jgi:hypothetical protein
MTTEPPAKKRGRPSLDTQDRTRVDVTVRLTRAQFDRLCEQARSDRVSVSELLRRGISPQLN